MSDPILRAANEKHDEAMRHCDVADGAKRLGHENTAEAMTIAAFKLEREAAHIVADRLDLEPTRSVLHRSAAVLAIRCGEYQAAKTLVSKALEGRVPLPIRKELQAIAFDLNSIDNPEPPADREHYDYPEQPAELWGIYDEVEKRWLVRTSDITGEPTPVVYLSSSDATKVATISLRMKDDLFRVCRIAGPPEPAWHVRWEKKTDPSKAFSWDDISITEAPGPDWIAGLKTLAKIAGDAFKDIDPDKAVADLRGHDEEVFLTGKAAAIMRRQATKSKTIHDHIAEGKVDEIIIDEEGEIEVPSDSYMALIREFPLLSIRDDEALKAARDRIDALTRADLDEGEAIYLGALSDLVGLYEARNATT